MPTTAEIGLGQSQEPGVHPDLPQGWTEPRFGTVSCFCLPGTFTESWIEVKVGLDPRHSKMGSPTKQLNPLTRSVCP